MNEATAIIPKMMTIRQVAATGILPEHAIRQMVKTGTCPHIRVGAKALVNFTALVEMLDSQSRKAAAE